MRPIGRMGPMGRIGPIGPIRPIGPIVFPPKECQMPDLIPPHGGVSEPVNRTVTDLGGPFAKTVALSDADLSSLYRIGDGALSPLTGPMTAAEWNQVLDEE